MDRVRFEELALSQLDAVYRLAFHLTRDADAAADLVQDVYARALRPKAIETFEDRSSLPDAPATAGPAAAQAQPAPEGKTPQSGMRSWLFTICHNVFFSQAKRASKAPAAVGEFFEASRTERAPGQSKPTTCLADLDWEQVDGRLGQILRDLKPEYREVLLLWGVEGLKYREIGEILDVPIGTVMSRLHRARRLVMDAIAADQSLASDLNARARSAHADEGL